MDRRNNMASFTIRKCFITLCCHDNKSHRKQSSMTDLRNDVYQMLLLDAITLIELQHFPSTNPM